MRGQIETISVNHTSDEYPPDGGAQKNAGMGLPQPLPGSSGATSGGFVPSLRVYSCGAGRGACSAMMALACFVRSSFSLGVKRLSPLTHLLI